MFQKRPAADTDDDRDSDYEPSGKFVGLFGLFISSVEGKGERGG